MLLPPQVVSLEEGKEVSYRYDGRQLQVVWAKPFAPQEARRIRVLYTLQDPIAGREVGREDLPHLPAGLVV